MKKDTEYCDVYEVHITFEHIKNNEKNSVTVSYAVYIKEDIDEIEKEIKKIFSELHKKVVSITHNVVHNHDITKLWDIDLIRESIKIMDFSL